MVPDQAVETPSARGEDGDIPLIDRPGFLIRRLHQIHLAMFYEACVGLNVTPVQSSILTVLRNQPGLDQARLASAIGIDRATVGQVIRRLAARGLVERGDSARDRRSRTARLTDEGYTLLSRIAPLTAVAHARTLATLSESERYAFLASLKKLVNADNARGRAPLRWGVEHG